MTIVAAGLEIIGGQGIQARILARELERKGYRVTFVPIHWGVLVHPWLRLPHEMVVPSQYLADVFARYGYRTRVLRNALDVSRFDFREGSLSEPHVVSTRNLEPCYRIDNTVRAFAILRERFPLAKLTIVAEGREAATLQALAGSLGGNGIRFVGRINRKRYCGCWTRSSCS